MTASRNHSERRHRPRVDLLSEFMGHLIALDEAVRVLQIGAGGMTIASAVPLQPPQVYDLRLTVDDEVLVVKARVVHSRATIDSDEFMYVAGIAFVDLSPEARAAIDRIIALEDAQDGDEPSERGTR